MAKSAGSKSLSQARRAQRARKQQTVKPAFQVPLLEETARPTAQALMPLSDALAAARKALNEALEGGAEQTPEAPLHVFVSVTDGTRRAAVVNACAPTQATLWQALENALAPHYALDTPVRWLRLDWTRTLTAHTWESLAAELKRHKRNYFRRGIALDPDVKMAFLEQELNANAMLYTGSKAPHAELNQGNFLRYARERFGREVEVAFEPSQPVYTFTTEALLVEPDQAPRRLLGYTGGKEGRSTGRRLVEPLTPDTTGALIEDASQFLAAQVEPNGRFIYGLHPCFDRLVAGYNTLRHASSIYSMLEAWEVTQSESLKHAIDRALEYLTTKLLQRFEHLGERVTYLLEENGEIKLGGSGVTLLALSKYTELTGDERYLALMEEVALGIRQLQLENGGFSHVLNAADLSVKDAFRIIYYDGEAAFGLMRLYGLTRDARWLAVVERAFEYFIDQEHWKAHDHWLSYCVNELTLYRPEERYYRFGLQNVAGYLDFVEGRITTFPTLLELMMAAHKLITRLQKIPEHHHLLALIDLGHFYRALEKRAHYLLNGHFWPEYAMYFKNPQRIVGSFFIRHHSFRVRIDDVEHYLSGFVAYLLHYLSGDFTALEKGRPAEEEVNTRPPAPFPQADSPSFISEGNWTVQNITAATQGRWIKKPDATNWRATGLSFHATTMAPGHIVVVKAEQGARGVPVAWLDKLPYKPQLLIVQAPVDRSVLDRHGVPIYEVSDTSQAILDLGNFARQKLAGKVVGVTGSAGKTTAINMLHQLLSLWGETGATRHSANLPYGIAWTLASVPWQARFHVIEMAIGRMRQNSALARPDIAVFLNAGPAHLEYHGTVEQVALRKSRIFEAMRPGGQAIINRDMAQWPAVQAAARKHAQSIISFGCHPEATIRWVNPDDLKRLEITYLDERVSIDMAGRGSHWAMNILATLGVLLALGLSPREALPFVGRVLPPRGRGSQRQIAWQGGELCLLNDAYNANPLSMNAMLSQARSVEARRKHLVLADMLELGADSLALHQALVAPIIASGAESVWLLGEQMQTLLPYLKGHIERVQGFATRQALVDALVASLAPGDWVAFKGSNKFGLSDIAQTLGEEQVP
ncbi:Mur ligase family protein [Vreelandella sp. EE27]